MNQKSPTETAIQIGKRIREARLAKGASQTDVGIVLGVSFQMVQKYERGINRISPFGLVMLAPFLGVTVNDLIGIDSNNQPTNAVVMVPGGQELLGIYRGLSVHKRKIALALLYALEETS